MIYLQLFRKLFQGRALRVRRRLCSAAADPGTGHQRKRLALDERVHPSGHDLPDDAGADRPQRRHLCRHEVAGIPGSIVATAGCVAPSCIIVTILAILYLKYKNASGLKSILATLRPATVALIGSAGVSILVTAFWGSDAVIGAIDFASTNGLMIALFVLSVVLLRKTKIGAVPVMVLAGVLKLCLALIGIG